MVPPTLRSFAEKRHVFHRTQALFAETSLLANLIQGRTGAVNELPGFTHLLELYLRTVLSKFSIAFNGL
jgi:hypothetical protein